MHALNQTIAGFLQLAQRQQVWTSSTLAGDSTRYMREARRHDPRQIVLQLCDLGAQRIDRGPLASMVIDCELLRDDDRPTSS